jgi:di/tricarboxylate transporter
MTTEQGILFSLIVLIFVFFIWGRIRYDIIAFSALVIASIAGVVPKDRIFSGFGHPAVMIIALVLIVSYGLSRSGAIELLARRVINPSRELSAHIGIMAGISAALSAIMNNVAALALLMPIDMQAARQAKRGPALTLMPLSFASILGGMVTLIGTPPNIVIATFREKLLGTSYRMFDFAPVGGIVALAGVAFVSIIGWRLLNTERSKRDMARELTDLEGYIAEVKVKGTSDAVDKALRELEPLAEDNDVALIGLVRRGKRLPGRALSEVVRKSDLIVIQGNPEAIDQFVGAVGLEHMGPKKNSDLTAQAISVVEVVVPEGARIEGKSALDIQLLSRQGVTLIGISRRGRKVHDRVRKEPIQAGDMLLLLGPEDQMHDVVAWLGCLQLVDRGLGITQRGKAWGAIGFFAAAIIGAGLGLIQLPLALAAVVAIYIFFRIVPISQIYESIEWPIILLLGSLIPLGSALESSGGTALIAKTIVNWTQGLPSVAVLTILMIVTMTLSDVLDNVATTLIAAPIGVDIASRLGANPDSFLMAVAVAASCAFLTPIGHKNNTIIMGPGGYKFGDYWRMGLPLEVLVILVGVPMILIVWPI